MNDILLKLEERIKIGKVVACFQLAKAIESYAPMLAGKLASDVWFTPLRHRAISKKTRLPMGAVMKEMEGLRFWTAGLDRAASTVILVHGWGGSSSQFFSIAEDLLKNNFRVIGFDFPSHGMNRGFSSDIIEMKGILHKVLMNSSGEIHLVCHSFGLLVAGQVLKHEMNQIKSVTGIASPVSFDFLIKQFMAKTKFNERIYAGLMAAIQRRVEGKIDIKRDIDLQAAMFRNIQCLFIYDELDKEVPLSEFERIQKLRPEASYLITKGLGHNKILASTQVSQEIVKFLSRIKNYTGPQTPHCPQ